MELKEALIKWEEKGRYGSLEERIKREKLWEPYYTFLAKREKGKEYIPQKISVDAVEFLLNQGALKPSDNALDIGAGTGGLTLELAKKISQVVSLEPNKASLDILKDRAKKLRLDNIKRVEGAWEYFDASSSYDVVFSSMCPAICNMEEILRMENMAERTCCILTVAQGSYEKCRKELLKGLNLIHPAGLVTDAVTYYDVLYLMGRKVNVKTFSYESKRILREEELIEQYSVYLKIFGIEDSISVPYMRNYLRSNYPDRDIVDEVKMNYSLIYWNKE